MGSTPTRASTKITINIVTMSFLLDDDIKSLSWDHIITIAISLPIPDGESLDWIDPLITGY
ncbi:MAG: hypothetical protein STSR0003_27180 [Smithella sp.]